ncbi:MAG: recombinase family protein [Phycisphaeraceae bacterium]|nr:recombinase family protein [Phycisphaeraceae bacterium]
MTRHRPNQSNGKVPAVRCAIYTRKSSEEGLEQEFNSLDAQRESGEAYIRSQSGEGWTCLPDRYDDGGFTGGNMDRPALKRLMADIEAGKIDCVVVYKVDRLSRSLLDFARMMEAFERHMVSFVSVTQQFNTASSMGRLVLNVLLSFAQFEREIISERTRDKIAATRRKGKWAGGHPILGYDVDPRGFRLVVNEEEAARVRDIFALYLEHQSLIATVKAIDAREWLNKQWTTRKGKARGGKPFDKNSVFKLLTNVAYLGKVKYKNEVHAGEHEAIVDHAIWQRAQQLLARNGRTGGAAVRNKYGALLKGLLYCTPCGCSMGHTYSTKNGSIQYRYYVCLRAQKRGWHTCPSKSIPAAEIERLVVEQVRAIGRDPALLNATLKHARKQAQEAIAALEAQRAALERDLKRHYREVRTLASEAASSNGAAAARLGDLNERIRAGEQAMTELREKAVALSREIVDEREVAEAMKAFDPVWETLSPREQARVVRLLVQQVDYDGGTGTVSLTFHPDGLRALSAEAEVEEVAV